MTITIFLTADDEPSNRLFEMVADWTAAGLLAESMWVRTGEWQRGERAVHDVGVEVLSGMARQADLLLPLLGPRLIGHVRLVVVHLAVSPPRPDTPLTGAARALVGLLGNRLPANTAITVLNVMVPSSETGQLPRGMLLELPTVPVVNIAVSPEDRRSDAHADIAVRNGTQGNFTGHAVLGCVTVAGLWRGVDTGPLDTSSLSSAFDEDVVVARTFASLVWSAAVVDDVSALVLAPRACWPDPRSPSAAPSGPTGDPAAAVDQAAARCRDLGRGVLRRRPAPRPAPAERRRVSLLRLVPGAAGFVVTRVWRPPSDLAIHATPAVLERATRLTGAAAGADPAPPVASPGPGATSGLDDLARQARAVLAAAGEAADGEAAGDAGAVWDEVRSVAFALVDGADPAPGVDGGPVVGDADLIAPDPWAPDTAAVEDRLAAIWPDVPPSLAAGGPYQARLIRAALVDLASDRDQGGGPGHSRRPVATAGAPGDQGEAAAPPPPGPMMPAADEVRAASEAGPATRPEPVAAAESAAVTGASGVAEPAAQVQKDDVRPVPAPEGDAAPTADPDGGAGPHPGPDVGATTAALDAWTGRRSGSLLWKVSEGLANDIRAAQGEMLDGLSALGQPPEVTGSRTLRRTWATCRRTCLTAIALALVLIGGYRLAGLRSSDFLTATVSTVVLAVLVVTVAFWRYRRVEVGLANGIQRDRAVFDTGFLQAGHGAAEVIRLVGLYRRLQDWSTVVGALAHRPFGVPPGSHPAPAPPLGAGLAMACNVAEGQVSDEQVRWLSAGAAATVFGPGWLGLVYEDLVESLPSRTGRSPGGGATTDSVISPVGADAALVSSLRAAVMDDGFAGWGYRRGRAQVAAVCLAQPLHRLLSGVTPAQPDVNADGPVDADLDVDAFVARTLPSPRLQQFLLGELWSETARVRRAHRVERMILWGPAGVAGAGAGGELTEWSVLPNVEGPEGQLVVRVIRLDCSARTPSRDLRLFTSVVTPVSRA